MNTRSQGFSLPEVLVVTVVGMIVLAAVYQTMTIQERANRQQLAIATTEQNARMSIDVLMNELREASATNGDILDATGTSITFRALQKAGFVCEKDATNPSRATVARPKGSSDFANGDTLVVFVDGTKNSVSDDDWRVVTVQNAPDNQVGCAGLAAWLTEYFTLSRVMFGGAAPLAGVDSGALVRSYRSVQYQVIDQGSGAVLQRIENGGTAMTIAESLASVAEQGLRLRYFNSAGTEINPTTQTLRDQISRIEIKARARAIGGESGARREFSDSLVNQVYLRGNYKSS